MGNVARAGGGRLVRLCLIVLTVAGCETLDPLKRNLYGDYAPKPLNDAVADNAYNDLSGAVKKDIFKNSDVCFTTDSIKTEAQKKQCQTGRAIMVASLEAASDAVCLEHIKSIYGNEAATNLILGTLGLGTSVTGTVAGAATTKSILAALSAFFIGEQSLINSVVYKEVVVPAVVKNIREMRDEQRAVIRSHGKEDIAAYPVPAALADLLKYHESCSFIFGLQRALDNSQNTQRERQLTVLQARVRELDLRIQARTTLLDKAGKSLDQIDADPELKALKKSRGDAESELFTLLKKYAGQESAGPVTPASQPGDDAGQTGGAVVSPPATPGRVEGEALPTN